MFLTHFHISQTQFLVIYWRPLMTPWKTWSWRSSFMRLLQSSGTFTRHSQCAKGDMVGRDTRGFSSDERFPPRGSRWFESKDVCVNGRVWPVWSAVASQWTDGPAGLWLGTEWECRRHRTDIDVFPHFRALPTHGQPNGSVDVWLVKSCTVLIVSVGGSWWTRSVHHWPKRTSCKSSTLTDLSNVQRWLH